MEAGMERQDYSRWVRAAGWAAVTVAITLILIKSVALFMTGSVSILASLMDSFMDVGASLINLMAIRFALQPPDDHHRFGYGKAEPLAGLAQAAFITGSSVVLLYNGIDTLLFPVPLESTTIGMVVMVISIILTLGLVTFQRWVVQRSGSMVIKADSLHYWSDLLMNSVVLLAVVMSAWGYTRVDGIMALLIAVIILRGAWSIGRDSVNALMDRALPENEQHDIVNIARAVPRVHGVHDLKTRQSGQIRFIQLHLELDDNLLLREAHDIAEQVEKRLAQRWPDADIIIHQDPLSVLRGRSEHDGSLLAPGR
jgi:ferrous-iron efflux pump FieF